MKALRDDEMHALNREHREANDAARHAARGTEAEAREEARHVEALSDHLARKDRSYEQLTEKLWNRVEEAADMTEDYSENLARRTQDRLEDNLSKAREVVRANAHRRLQALHEAETTEEAARKMKSFLAQSSGAMYDSAPMAFLALVGGVACSCVVFLATRNTRRVVIHSYGLLG